jgi:hypothetical protein
MKTGLDLYSEDFQLMEDFINNPTLENQFKLALSLARWYGNRVTERPQKSIELMPYFSSICNRKDWKSPINAFCRKEDKEKIKEAIEYFTSTAPEFDEINDSEMVVSLKGWLQVSADGYRLGPAGDN